MITETFVRQIYGIYAPFYGLGTRLPFTPEIRLYGPKNGPQCEKNGTGKAKKPDQVWTGEVISHWEVLDQG